MLFFETHLFIALMPFYPMRPRAFLALVFVFALIPASFALSVRIWGTEYNVVSTKQVSATLIGNYTLYLDFSRGKPSYFIDDFAVTRIPYGPDANLISNARAFLAYLFTSGYTPAVVSHVWVYADSNSQTAFLVAPLVHAYKPLSAILSRYDFLGTVEADHYFIKSDSLFPVQTTEGNVYVDRDTVTDTSALAFLPPDPTYPPDGPLGYYERDTYGIYDLNHEPGPLSDPPIFPGFAIVVGDRAPHALSTLYYIVQPSPHAGSGDTYSSLRITGAAMDEYCSALSVIFHQRVCFNDNFHVSAVTDPRLVSISVDHNVNWDLMDLLSDFADTYVPSRDLYNYPGMSSFSVGAAGSSAGMYQFSTRFSRVVTLAFLSTKPAPPEQNTTKPAPQPKPKPKTVVPAVHVWTDTPAITTTGSSFYLTIFNPSTSHPLHIWVYPTVWGFYGPPFDNVPMKPFDFNLPPAKHVTFTYTVRYPTSPKPYVTFRVVSQDLNTLEFNSQTVTQHFTTAYSMVRSFCLDKNFIAYVSNGTIVRATNCGYYGGVCKQNSFTSAHCTGTSLLDRANEVYHSLYGKSGNNFLLFGATGFGAELVRFLEGRSAAAAGAGAAASGLSGLLMGLGSIAVAYLAYRFIPDNCPARPVVALGAIPVGLLFGGVGVLALSAAGLAYCYLTNRP